MNHFGNKTGRLGKMAVLGLLGAILCPCTCPSIIPQEPTPEGQVETVGEEEIEETLEFLVGASETPLGTFETYDLDNDGKEDRFVYSFLEEEVAEDLFLGRSIEYQEADYGYDGRIELRFENKGDEAVEYWHIEDIPKEFAESVDDLEFSVPPDEIIDPDPKVKSKVQFDRRAADDTVESFLNIIKRSATTDLEETAHDLTQTMLVYQMRTLDRLVDKKGRDKRLLELARQFKREIAPKLSITAISNPEALAVLCGRASNPAIYHACAAILTDDASKCDELKKSGDKDLCKALLIQARCEEIKDQKKREECYFQQAIDLGSELACLHIKTEDDKHLCMARVTGKEDYCQKITDPDKKQACLEALRYTGWFTDENARDYCIELQIGSARLQSATIMDEEDCPTLMCVYALDVVGGGELEFSIAPLASDAAAERVWAGSVEWFNQEKAKGGFDDYVAASLIPGEPYEMFLVRQYTDGFFIEVETRHRNCCILSREYRVQNPGGAAARQAIEKARPLIDRLRGD